MAQDLEMPKAEVANHEAGVCHDRGFGRLAFQTMASDTNERTLICSGMPQPTDAEILAIADFSQLARNALLLTLASSWDDFADLAPLFKLSQTDVPFTAKAQDRLRAQNDKTVARLYGITDAEWAHLLRSFKGLAAKRPEYITLLQ